MDSLIVAEFPLCSAIPPMTIYKANDATDLMYILQTIYNDYNGIIIMEVNQLLQWVIMTVHIEMFNVSVGYAHVVGIIIVRSCSP